MAALRSTVFNLLFYTYTFGVAMTLYALARLSTQARMRRVVRRWGETVLWAVRVILGSTVEIRGRENLPDHGPYILVSKHQSELDIVVLAALFPDTSAVAMAELARYPFFGPILRTLDVVLVAVDAGPQGRTAQVIEGAQRIAAQGRPMMIYPEGELMKLGARERYRRGAGHIYCATGQVAIPVANALGVVWPQRRWRKPVGQTGALEFLAPIQPGLALEPFMAEVERRIETGSMTLIRACATGEALTAAEERYARGVNNHGVPMSPQSAIPPETGA